MNASGEWIFTREAYVLRVLSLGDVNWSIEAFDGDAGNSGMNISAFWKTLRSSILLIGFPFHFYCFF